jgi:PAS domain S-box-containing protein
MIMKNKLLATLLVFLILLSHLAATQLKVGLYDNPPKLYRDKQGNAAGFWADITSEIATNEGYEVVWVFANWEDCLRNLETGAIDLLPDVSYTEKRAEKYLFAQTTVLLSWSRIYIHPNSQFSSIIDLNNKRIAALKGSVNLEGKEGLRDLLSQFKIKAEIVEFPDYHSVFEEIEAKTVFAGVTNKDFATRALKDFRVKATPLIFQPVDLRFAFSHQSNFSPDIVRKFDNNVTRLKNDSDSIYHSSMEKHLGKSTRQKFIPSWLKISFVWLIVFLLISLLTIILLNLKLTRKIKETDKLNLQWETTFDTINDHIWILDKDYRIIKTNHPPDPKLDLPLDDILGKQCYEVVHQQDCPVDDCPLKSSKKSKQRESMELKVGENWFKVIVDPLLDAENQLQGAVHIIQDISQSKEYIERLQSINQQLAASEQELQAINQQLEASEQQLQANNQQLEAHEKQLIETNMRLCREIAANAENQKELSQELAIKKTLYEELFHRTKNNMQIISSMLNSEVRRSHNSQQTKSLVNIRNKIYALSLVQSKLYESENLSEINLKSFIDELVHYLSQHFALNAKNIELDLQLEKVYLLIDYALPLGLVINEIVSNIFMHAFPQQTEGKITIRLEKKSEKIFLYIADNGKGISDNQDLSTSDSVGLHNIFSLVKYQLKGDISYQQQAGLAWQISFKCDQYQKRV